MILNRIALYLLSFVIACFAHVQPGVKLGVDTSCADIPPFQSYHIHILFWQNNKNSTAAAKLLLAKFMDAFHLNDSNMCKYNPGDLNETDLCVFEVTLFLIFYIKYKVPLTLQTDYAAAGPFLTAQTAVFIPVDMYEQTVSWMVKYRGKLDMFVHPNSGCGLEDHVVHGLWGGNKWEIDASIFLD